MRRTYLIVSAAFSAGVLLSIAIAQSDVVTIENKYGKRLKSPVTLSHKKLADTIACAQCHHEWKKEQREDPQKCAECHKEEAEGKKLGLKMAYLQAVLHGMS